ncbi:MAG: HAD family hydrolase [Sporichthyaceae bacterium]
MAGEQRGEGAQARSMRMQPLPDVAPEPAAAAFFDVDNTIVRGASIFQLARGLYSRRFLTNADIVRFALMQAKFVIAGSEDLDHMNSAQARALAFIEGHSVAELQLVGEEIFDELISKRIWPGTRALTQMHLDAGQRVWLVTATPIELARTIADRLGLTGALGTVAEVENGFYTGRLNGAPLHGPAKADAVAALARAENLDLERCSAYSDSANDIPLLSLVGHPCAVNPDAKLRSHAKANGWRIRDYRTGRKAAKIGLPTAAGAGAVAGGIAAAVSIGRRAGG